MPKGFSWDTFKDCVICLLIFVPQPWDNKHWKEGKHSFWQVFIHEFKPSTWLAIYVSFQNCKTWEPFWKALYLGSWYSKFQGFRNLIRKYKFLGHRFLHYQNHFLTTRNSIYLTQFHADFIVLERSNCLLWMWQELSLIPPAFG